MLLLLQYSLSAQDDSTDVILALGPEVSIDGVVSSGINLSTRSSDSNIAELLSRLSGMQIQSQGGPYLKTALYRGQSARHMAIIWEGVNVQNSFNGTYDLGLMPSTIFGNSKWYDGGQSAAIGTAAMSGALVLGESINMPLISAGFLYSDMNNRRVNLVVQNKSDRISHSFQANLLDNENAYRYQSRDTILKRTKSDHNQLDLTYRGTMRWSKSKRTYLSYWYQNVSRMLPPSTIATNMASQDDRNQRLSIGHDWQYSSQLYWSTKLAYMNEYLGYMQPGIESLAESNVVNLNSKVKFDGSIDHTFGLSLRYENGALVDSINPSFESFFPERNTSAIFYNGIMKKDRTSISLSLRQEWIDTDFQIPTGQLALRIDASDRLNYTLNFGRHYSYPGFNDLYWPTGGNPELIAEKSWQVEGGVSYRSLIAKVYQIFTSDKILWAPNEQNIWTPENVASTSSSGFEIKYNREFNILKIIRVKLTPIVNYNHTINTANGVNNGNELLYNPKLNVRLNAAVEYRQLSLTIDELYTSKRFQTLDNASALDAYNLLNVELNYNWNVNQKYKSYIYIGAKNLFDESYELVRFYPQALRSIYMGVNFSIQ